MLATGRLGRERDDTAAVAAEDDAGLDRDRPAERVPDGHEPATAFATREIGRGGQVVHAAAEVVRLAIADAHRADALLRERDPERVVDAVRGAEQAPHPAAARDHDVGRVPRTVPQQRQQPAHRVHLDVAQVGVISTSSTASASSEFERRARIFSHDDPHDGSVNETAELG